MLHSADVVCRLLMFLMLVSMYLSAWLVVLMTADRFVAVWFPFRAPYVCSVARARLAASILLGVTVAINSHVFFTFRLQEFEKSWYCQPYLEYDFMFGPFEYVKLASYCIVPFAIILGLNVAIITRLRRVPSELRRTTGVHFTTTMPALRRGQGHRMKDGDVVDNVAMTMSRTVARRRCRESSNGSMSLEGPPLVEGRRSIQAQTTENAIGVRRPNRMRLIDRRLEPALNVNSRHDVTTANVTPRSNVRRHLTVTQRRQNKVTSMLLAVSLTWLLLTAPFTLFGIIFIGNLFDIDFARSPEIRRYI